MAFEEKNQIKKIGEKERGRDETRELVRGETRGKSWGMRSRRQETGDVKQDEERVTMDETQETGDKGRETETGDRRWETRWEARDKR